jgi:hypothetical protein
MKTSPTQRTLKHLRECGFTACIVEKWNPYARVRQDAFGFGDLLACVPADSEYRGTWLVQTTSGANHAARRRKIEESYEARNWRVAGGRIAVLSWTKIKGRWAPRWEEVDFKCPA